MSDRYKGAILSPTAPTVTPQSAGGIYTSSQQLQYQGQGVWPTAFNNPINNSLRFRSSASAYLNRTPASATNRTTWTWSAWVKRGDVASNDNRLFGAGTSNSDRVLIAIENYISLVGTNSGSNVLVLQTTPVYRDPSAWYHIVVAIDTTQATASNRAKIYVNGVQVTAFGTATYPAQNTTLQVNSANPHVIGTRGTYSVDSNFDGYFTEFNFIDGTALTPSSFGTTDAYGIWQPIPYTGAYGTNGFYLPFTDNSALTTSSNVGLGKDFSGNGNYWVTNNISITAGSTYDSMKDVPTNTNSNTANYCVLNPLVISTIGGTKSNGNLLVTSNSSTYAYFAMPTMFVSSGKWYAEVVMQSGTGCIIGIVPQNPPFSGNYIGAAAGCGTGLYETGSMFNFNNAGSIQTGLSTFTTGTVVGVALDMDNDIMNIYLNGTILATGRPNNNCVTYSLKAVSSNWSIAFGNNATYTTSINYGQQPFSYTPPSGFYPLNTYNLPTPTILDGDQYMDATLYTATTGTNTIVNAGGFQPDFVWIKSRSNPQNHYLVDSVRGGTSLLRSNTTDAESIYSTPAWIISFNSNGFTSSTDSLLTTGYTYVGWQWRASNAAGVSNTQGTITSTVSANTTAGFSIVTWTGNGASSATIGHGLGIAPSMIIVKNRSATWGWFIYNRFLTNPNTGRLQLNLTNGEIAGGTPGPWNNTAPTSTVFSLGDSTFPEVNGSGNLIVAYCFAPVAGYSAFGSYTGNGSADGPFIYTGFRPAFLLIKRTDSAGGWYTYDDVRSTYNLNATILQPNLSDAEFTGTNNSYDFLSNGFKNRGTGGDNNASGGTYIYMAFAENPFKIARGR